MTALLLALLLSSLPPPVEQSFGSLTLLEGSLKVIRGTTVYQGAEGMQLKPGDILETSDAAFAQLEFPTGIVALGPQTRMYILPAGGTSAGQPVSLDLIVLNGWLKSETAPAKSLSRFRTPLLAVSNAGGSVVVRSSAIAADVFLESGSTFSLSEVSPNGEAGSSSSAKAGQFFSRQKSASVITAARPSSTFLEALPKQFRDTLPPRQQRALEKPLVAKSLHAVTYEDVDQWLKMPSSWRRGLAQRFAPRLADSSFRKQIEAHVNEFPEWDPILHPKKSSESP